MVSKKITVMKIGISHIGLAIACVILFFSIRDCNSYMRDAENWKAQHDFATHVIDSFNNEKGLQVVEQVPAGTNDNKEIKSLSAQVFNLKKDLEAKIAQVSALVTARQEFVINGEDIPYHTIESSPPADSMVHAKDVIIPPRNFRDSSTWYDIQGQVRLQGIHIDSLDISNQVSFRIAEKRKGLFGKEQILQVINSNPYVKTTGSQSMVLKRKASAWNQWIKPALAAGAALLIKNQIK